MPRRIFEFVGSLARVVVLTAVLSAPSAISNSAAAADATTARTIAAAGIQQTPDALTPADVTEFVTAMNAAVAAGDVAAMNAMIDWDTFLDLATRLEGAVPPRIAEVRQSFRDGFKQSQLKDTAGLAASIIAEHRSGGRYRQLQTISVSKELRPLFRLVRAQDGSINYHAWRLARRADGKVRAVDVFIWIQGMDLSESVRQVFQGAVAAANAEAGDATARRYASGVQAVAEMSRALAGGNYASVIDQYAALPQEVKTNTVAQVLRLSAAARISPEAYATAVTDLRTAHPNNPTLDFVLIDGYALQKDFAQAIAAVDATEKVIGGDPFLNVLRAGLLSQQQKSAEAMAAAKLAIDAEPGLPWGYIQVLRSALQTKDYDAAVAQMRKLKELKRPITDISRLPDSAEFMTSPQYEAWKKEAN